MAASEVLELTASPMSFNSTTGRNGIRFACVRQLIWESVVAMLLCSFPCHALSQCHMLIQWRRNVLILTGNGSHFFIVTVQFVAHAYYSWTLRRGNVIDLILTFRESKELTFLVLGSIIFVMMREISFITFPPADCHLPKQKFRGKNMVIFLGRNSTRFVFNALTFRVLLQSHFSCASRLTWIVIVFWTEILIHRIHSLCSYNSHFDVNEQPPRKTIRCISEHITFRRCFVYRFWHSSHFTHRFLLNFTGFVLSLNTISRCNRTNKHDGTCKFVAFDFPSIQSQSLSVPPANTN